MDDNSNDISQSLFEYLGLKNEPRTGERIEGVLDTLITTDIDEDIVWTMREIDRRVDEEKDEDN